MRSCLLTRWAQHNKRLPPSVCLPLMLMTGQPIRQLAALPRVKMVGSMIHFAMRKKKRESACERRNSQDHWEIIRRSGVVDLELNGIINQAKKQARCSYIYYLHVFHFRRCNKQIYVGAPDLCHWDLEAKNPFRPLTLKARSGICSAQWLFCFPHWLSSPHNALCLRSNLQNKPHRIVWLSPCPLN